jgi:RNA polymerase sigma-70 factor, ECF subfamily
MPRARLMTQMEANDAAVVNRVRAGDEEAFGILVERHSRAVFRLAFRMTGHEQDAEDVVQETFLRAYRQLARFEERSSFGTWLYRIGINCAHDLMRQRQASGRAASLDDPDAPVGPIVESGTGGHPERLAFSAEVQRTVTSTMQTLSPLERSAFVLRHFEGRTIDEIGGILGLKTSAAKHSVFRAVQKMRRALEPLMTVEP